MRILRLRLVTWAFSVVLFLTAILMDGHFKYGAIFLCLATVLMNGCFRCKADPCKRSFGSGRAVTLHRLTCPHYEASISCPQPKWPSSQIPCQLSKRARQEDENPPTPNTTELGTPSPSDSSWAYGGAAEFLSPVMSLLCLA